jgi:hypothetical protein
VSRPKDKIPLALALCSILLQVLGIQRTSQDPKMLTFEAFFYLDVSCGRCNEVQARPTVSKDGTSLVHGGLLYLKALTVRDARTNVDTIRWENVK